MRIGTIEDYVKDSYLDNSSALEDTLAPAGIRDQFPFMVIVEGDYPEFDVAGRWCWRTFGPRHGECDWHSTYPACPIILATEKVEKTVIHSGQEFKYLTYANPTEHSHQGSWTTYWFGKTGYDYGYGAFCFSNENEKMKFINYLPEVNLGENYI